MVGWAANAFDITEIAQSTIGTWMHVVLGDVVIGRGRTVISGPDMALGTDRGAVSPPGDETVVILPFGEDVIFV